MGSIESKPEYISDDVWLEYQREKLQQQRELENLKFEKRKEEKEMELIKLKEKRAKMENRKQEMMEFAIHMAEYVNKCHDVPQYMMLFPERRRQCHVARTELLRDMVSFSFDNIEIEDEISKVISDLG